MGVDEQVVARDSGRFLSRHPEFARLWVATTASLIGTQITFVALPLCAAFLLHASAFEVGALYSVGYAAYLVLGLPVGAWVDRAPRRRVLIAADLGRAFLLLLVPALHWTGGLTIEVLLVVGGLVGVLSVFHDSAYMAWVPGLVGRDGLLGANVRLATSASAAEVTGPAITAALLAVVTSATVILVDVFSYVLSGVVIRSIEFREPPRASVQDSTILKEIHDGLRVVVSRGPIRALAIQATLANLFTAMLLAVLVLYLARDVAVAQSTIAVIFALGGAGALAGAAVATRLSVLLGYGPGFVSASVIATLSPLLLLAAGHPGFGSVLFVVLMVVLLSAGTMVVNVLGLTMRQALVDADRLGRVTANFRLLAYGGLFAGALLGGALGDAVGLRRAVIVIACLFPSVAVLAMLSPIRAMRELPQPDQASLA